MSAAQHWSDWERALGEGGLVSYRYVGCSSRATSAFTAEGGYRLRPDLRTADGALMVAPLGIAMLDTAGINVDALSVVAPTQIDLTVLDPRADDVTHIAIRGRVVRQGRTQMVTEAQMHDAARPDRLLAYGTATWAVVGPCPDGYRYVDPGPGIADGPALPQLYEAFDAVRRPGGGYEVAGLSTRVGARSLHQGPIQVLLETAGLDAAGPGVAAVHSTTSIVQRGATGPFVATADVIGSNGDRRAIRAVLRDEGAGDRVVALSFLTGHVRVR